MVNSNLSGRVGSDSALRGPVLWVSNVIPISYQKKSDCVVHFTEKSNEPNH